MAMSRDELETAIARMEASNRVNRANSTPVRAAGFFRETDNDDRLPSIRAFLGKGRYADEAAILSYLRSGTVFGLRLGGYICDALTGVPLPDVVSFIRTDGVWAWPEETSHYLASYGLQLPDEFIAHIRHNNYETPDLEGSELACRIETDDGREL